MVRGSQRSTTAALVAFPTVHAGIILLFAIADLTWQNDETSTAALVAMSGV